MKTYNLKITKIWHREKMQYLTDWEISAGFCGLNITGDWIDYDENKKIKRMRIYKMGDVIFNGKE